MPLDPVLAQLVNALPTETPVPIDWPALRASAKAMMPLIVGDGPLTAVASVEDRDIDGPASRLPIRIYRPDAPTHITLIHIHGGGWCAGELDTVDHTVRLLCQALPAVIVSCTYRLAPEHPFPAAFEDAQAASRWALDRVAELGGDAGCVVIGGDSAGGNLTAAVAMAMRDAARAKGGEEVPSPFRAQLLLYPATDLRESAWRLPSRVADSDPTLNAAMLRECYAAYAGSGSADDVRMSPAAASDLSGLPEAVVVAVDIDPLRDEALDYARRLHESGVKVELLTVENMTHGFIHLAALVPAAKEQFDRLINKIRDVLSN